MAGQAAAANDAAEGPWNAFSLAATLAAMSAAGRVLLAQGRTPWCACEAWTPWSFDIQTKHNSQHLFDPYSFTHLLHGVVGFGLTAVLPRAVPMWARLALVAVFESVWELVENSPTVIDKYRTATISLDYYGDSVANSMSDIVCCVLGFTLASRLRWWQAVLLFVAVEATLLLWVRDSLVVNLIMLISPIEALKAWQARG
jgi:hypothetical protein